MKEKKKLVCRDLLNMKRIVRAAKTTREHHPGQQQGKDAVRLGVVLGE
jgi:hypothetical protein